ncbi:MAG: hypothetical protein ABI868_18745 [Acidobacteriota bacterium]
MNSTRLLAGFVLMSGIYATAAVAQYSDSYVQSRDHPAIGYSKGPVTDRVAAVNRQLADGSLQLKFDGPGGYLRSALTALNIPVESQVAVFAQNSSQGPLIGMKNPRALYFNDAVALGFVRGGGYLEVATHDPRQGVIFYTLEQTASSAPQFKRDDQCLACHLTWSTRGVPGLFTLSMLTLPDDKNSYASGFVSNHTTSFDTRWGGWYVTGNLGSIRHMANLPVSTTTMPAEPATSKLVSLEGRFDLTGYPTPYSDVAALLVLEHQTHITNLITRLGWEARLEAYQPGPDAAPSPAPPAARSGAAAKDKTSRVEIAAADLVDYALFVYETPLSDKVRGSSGFAEKFAAIGPADGKGRSLRQFDLDQRMMKYPCSYMIYSDAFDALPAPARDQFYRRLWQVLSGQDKDAKYATLSLADRRAVVEILRETKKGLPDYFQVVAK